MSKRWRRLTDNEIKMAKLIFADSIDYARVKIYQGIPCLPTMQVAVRPTGTSISRAIIVLTTSPSLPSPIKYG